MSDAPKPFYRRDGQVHNFGALPWPGKLGGDHKKYDAWFDYTRPEPKRNVSQMDVEDHSKKFGVPIPTDLPHDDYILNCLLKHRTRYES